MISTLNEKNMRGGNFMCTSFTVSVKDQQHYLSRTMDFSFLLEGQPIFMPRGFEWSSFNGEVHQNAYAFVGTGKKLEDYIFADGVNEKGVVAAELYYPNEADYATDSVAGQKNLAPHQFIMWLLGENSSIAEIKEKIGTITLVDCPVALLGITVPLHFIVTDSSGETITIETNQKQLILKDNPIGVMANSPNLEWHLQNLNQYASIKPTNNPSQKLGPLTLTPFGQGSGTFGLPGSYVSTDRFVRAAFLKYNMVTSTTMEETVNNIFHVLDSVTIPKGIDIKPDGEIDFTQYRVVMDSISSSYFLQLYESNRVYSVKIDAELLTNTAPIVYPVSKDMLFEKLEQSN